MVEKEEEELEPLEDDDEPVDLEELEDLDDDDAAAVVDDDDDEEDEASLDEILAQRPAARRGGEDADEDEEDLLAFAPEPKIGSADPLPSKITPIKEQAEFVCKRCHLVKKRSQLADPERTLCRDCV